MKIRKKEGKITKIHNMLIVPSIITSLVLTFSFQVLAEKIEIQGWDKAKFGMSPGESRNAYKEEEKYFEQKPHLGSFWGVREENKFGRTVDLSSWSGPLPYTLYTAKLRVLGKQAGILFRFVNNKLFEIEIRGEPIYEKAELEELKLNLENALVAKYGEPIREEQSEKEKLLKWKDSNDNILILKIRLKPEKGGGGRRTVGSMLFPPPPCYTVEYIDKELKEVWERKIKEWEKEKKSLEEKGAKSF